MSKKGRLGGEKGSGPGRGDGPHPHSGASTREPTSRQRARGLENRSRLRECRHSAARASEIPRKPRATARDCSRLSWNRSEEHTSELQSRQYLVCRLLLEKKKKSKRRTTA